ncbi:ABC transporter ATP-binding protein [Streptomyces luomodiensis]|uniref:ABC transporter ATP-binding protein n=1 Tax=Streptomyces luomodiensis TaxID=3026192 RepID=A0ABY9UWE6_9ACTN|nr:ABC transporter ATP-binding protein [Streptomyces sp. SCA4-21]WNE94795.1 ABC transporter ATP-binding protein [Streptomyces sp. SCA4-21]
MSDTSDTSDTRDTSAPTPLVEVEDLQIELITDRGVVRAVDGVGFTIGAGETVTIIGESGSGKSTTAMGLLRLLPEGLAVLSGTARISGVDVIADPKAAGRIRGRGVSLIPQDPMTALSPVHTIGRQLGEALRLRHPGMSRAEARAKGVELLGRVRIPRPETRWGAYPHQFSGGMLQRVLIAIALAAEPRLLVADEPTSALDVTVQAGVLDLLMELQERTGVGILMITHDLGVARLVSDRIHVMRGGRFVESGPVEQIVDHPRERYTRDLLAAVPTLGPWDETPAVTPASATPASATPASATPASAASAAEEAL